MESKGLDDALRMCRMMKFDHLHMFEGTFSLDAAQVMNSSKTVLTSVEYITEKKLTGSSRKASIIYPKQEKIFSYQCCFTIRPSTVKLESQYSRTSMARSPLGP